MLYKDALCTAPELIKPCASGMKMGGQHDPGYVDMPGMGPPHPMAARKGGYDTLGSAWRPGPGGGGRSADSPVWRQPRNMDYASDTEIPSPPRFDNNI